jgi:hypothetical protein
MPSFAIVIGAISAVLCVSIPALAFDVDGYSSGISVDQLISLAHARRREVWQFDSNPPRPGQNLANWAIKISKEAEIDVTFSSVTASRIRILIT